MPQIDMPKCIRHIYLQEVNLTVSMYPSNQLYLFPAIITGFALLYIMRLYEFQIIFIIIGRFIGKIYE